MFHRKLADFGVAAWGDDFAPEEHKGKIRTSEQDAYFPTVGVYLPVCGEPTHLLDNTWKYVSALDYPNVTVYISDDGGEEEVLHLARMYGFYCRFLDGAREGEGGNCAVCRSMFGYIGTSLP